ncbi:hypothetical protein BKI52_31230 [marine bacterium AO1-C]|nr:hypothetical protein BKI52_31230 [marine bacterium AO1-C]
MISNKKLFITGALLCICAMFSWGQGLVTPVLPPQQIVQADVFFVKPYPNNGNSIRFLTNDNTRSLSMWKNSKDLFSFRSTIASTDDGWRWDVSGNSTYAAYLSNAGDLHLNGSLYASGANFSGAGVTLASTSPLTVNSLAEFKGELRARSTARFYNLARFYSTLKIESGGQFRATGNSIFDGSATFNAATTFDGNVQFNGNVDFGNNFSADFTNPKLRGDVKLYGDITVMDDKKVNIKAREINLLVDNPVAGGLKFRDANGNSHGVGFTYWTPTHAFRVSGAGTSYTHFEEDFVRHYNNVKIQSKIGSGLDTHEFNLFKAYAEFTRDLRVGGALTANDIKTEKIDIKSPNDPAGDGWKVYANADGFKISRQQYDNQGNPHNDPLTYFHITHGAPPANASTTSTSSTSPELHMIGIVKFMSQGNVPDYVFEPDYKLLTLKDLGTYIKKNKHLPGVPSAKQIKEDGFIDAVKMDYTLLEKIEELTLYTLQQEKQLKAKQTELDKLKQRMAKMEELLKQVVKNHKK